MAREIIQLGKLEIDLDELAEFLVEAKRNGWAGNAKPEIMPDGSEQITFQDGDFHYTDNYAGSKQFAGSETVRWQKPEGQRIWQMSYLGLNSATSKEMAEIRGFLKKELMRVPKEYPFRGPVTSLGSASDIDKGLSDSEFPGLTYYNNLVGSIGRFRGNEQIKQTKERDVWISFGLGYQGSLIIPK